MLCRRREKEKQSHRLISNGIPKILNKFLTITSQFTKIQYTFENFIIINRFVQVIELIIPFFHMMNRVCEKLVDETVIKIKDLEQRGELKENQYTFLAYLLSKPDVTYEDVQITALNRMSDGLTTVS